MGNNRWHVRQHDIAWKFTHKIPKNITTQLITRLNVKWSLPSSLTKMFERICQGDGPTGERESPASILNRREDVDSDDKWIRFKIESLDWDKLLCYYGYSIWTSSWLFPYVTIASVYNPEYFSFYLKNRYIKILANVSS